MNKIQQLIFLAFSLLIAVGCEPEVGSKAWCEKLDETPKSDWSFNEAGEYTKNCIFRKSEDKD